jgi:hypothetical protein
LQPELIDVYYDQEEEEDDNDGAVEVTAKF